MTDNKNFIVAIVLSSLIIFGWQYFYAGPQAERQRRLQEQQQQQTSQQVAPAQPGTTGVTPQPGAAPQPGTVPQPGLAEGAQPREQVLQSSPRIPIDTPSLSGSISLKGAQIDDLQLKRYHETVDPSSPTITLLSPMGTEQPYFVESGWTMAGTASGKLPNAQSQWQVAAGAKLTPETPVKLSFDNGEGLVFHKTIGVDDNYMFTVKQEVENKSAQPVTLFPYSRIMRVGQPKTANFYILHEGLLGVLGGALQEVKYKHLMDEEQSKTTPSTGGWLGITDKYWAVALIPGRAEVIDGSFR